MKTIRNLTRRPLRIPLSGGKVLHLGPAQSGQISDGNLERPAVRRMIDAKEVEILESGPASSGRSGGEPAGHESTHGRATGKTPHPTGDR